MIRRFFRSFTMSISLVAIPGTLMPSAQAQVIQPGAEPQPSPGSPNVEPPRAPRTRQAIPPARTRPAPQADAPTAGMRRPMLSAFVAPGGLSEPLENLLADLGYESGKTVPLTPHTTFDLAYKCYADGRYSDAMVFASHGLRMCNDARLHLIKGVCELQRGMVTAAELTAVDYRNAIAGQQLFGIDVARERINDSMALRFSDIVEYQATGR
jgi:hypothetical protein